MKYVLMLKNFLSNHPAARSTQACFVYFYCLLVIYKWVQTDYYYWGWQCEDEGYVLTVAIVMSPCVIEFVAIVMISCVAVSIIVMSHSYDSQCDRVNYCHNDDSLCDRVNMIPCVRVNCCHSDYSLCGRVNLS